MGATLIPNSFQHPNAYIDWLSYYLTGEEEKVLSKAIREILGMHNKIASRRARIALSVFVNGKVINGEQVCMGCGLSLDAVRKALVSLNAFNILVKVGELTNDGQEYMLTEEWDAIKWEALRQRREGWDSANQQRIAKARGVLSDRRQGSCGTEGKGLLSDSNKETQASLETHEKPSFPAPDGGGEPLREGENGDNASDLRDVGDNQGSAREGGRRPSAAGLTGREGSSPTAGDDQGRYDDTGSNGRTGPQSSRPRSKSISDGNGRPGNSVIHKLLSRTLTEGGNGDGRQRQKWETPETSEQTDFLAVCGAKWFKPKQKAKVKAILTALRAGAMAGDGVYQKCMDAIADRAELEAPLPPMPQSWYDWRGAQAKTHRWSVDGFINALLNRDGLMAHCQYHLRQKGAPTEAANDYGPDPMLMNMPGGGNGKQSASAGKPHRQNVWDKPGYYDDSAN